jgi:phage shock protein PspC (stress-responsive transcriptional regulator)
VQILGMELSMNATDSSGTEPPRADNPLPAQPGVLAPKRIYRDPKGPIGGVAGGFAGYFDVDPVIPRLLWVVALLSGIGFPAYLLCWIVIPKAQSWPPPGYQGLPAAGGGTGNDMALLSGLLIVSLAAVIGAGVDGIGNFILPAALVGFGVYLLNQRAQTSAGGEPEVSSAAADTNGANDASWSGAMGRIDRRGLVTPTVISMLAIGAGVMVALHAAGLVPLSITGMASAGLVVVGVGLVASLWLGRARGLVPLGLGLVTLMLGAATIGPLVDKARHVPSMIEVHAGTSASEAMGDTVFAPESLDALMPRYDLGMGKLTLDLTHLDFTGEVRDIELNVGLGELLVILPEGVSADVSVDVGIGKVEAFGISREGIGNSLGERDEGSGDGLLDIELNVGLGRAQVLRANP